jgi:HEAT repeat protein
MEVRFPAALEPGALYSALRTAGPDPETARLVGELGRLAARGGWARRFLFDVAQGRLAISPQQAAPALAELARLSAEPVVELLQSGDAHGSLAAGVAFGLDFEAFSGTLLATARGRNPSVRLAASSGLAEAASRGRAEAADCLGELLDDTDPQVRWTAAVHLGRSRGAAAGRALDLLACAAGSEDERLWSGAAFGLVRLREARPGPCTRLLRELAERDAAGRRSVAFVVRHLPRRAAAGLASLCLADEDPDTRAVAISALAGWATDSEPARRELVRLTRDGHPLVRATSAEAVAAGDGPFHRDLLERLAADSSPLVRSAVARGLAKHGRECRDVLVKLLNDEVGYVRRAAIAGLDPEDGVALREALRDPDPGVRAAASSALKPQSPGDRDLLLSLTYDRDAMVARAAAAALARAPGAAEGPIWDRLVEIGSGAVATALDRAPERAAEAIWEWPVGPTTAGLFSEMARSAETWQVAELTRTARRALLEEEDPCGALEDLATAFEAAGSHSHAEQIRWLSACAGCQSALDIAKLETQPPAGKSEDLSLLAICVREAAGASRASGPSELEQRLARADAAVERLLEMSAGTLLPRLTQRIGLLWREIIRRDFESPRAPRLHVRLVTTSVVIGGPSRLTVEIENRFPEPLTEGEISLPGSNGATGAPQLRPGQTCEVEIPWTATKAGSSIARAEVRYRGPGGESRVQLEGIVTARAHGALQSAANPYIVGKPLAADSTMFFGRAVEMEYVERALAAGEDGSVVVLTGQRRTGKTSLLRRLAGRLAAHYRLAFIDVQGILVENIEGFFQELIRAVASSDDLGGMLSDGDSGHSSTYGPDLVREAAERSERPVVLLMDEFDDLNQKVESGRISPEVFPQLRKLVQHTRNLRLVLCGTHRLEEFGGGQWSFLLNLATYKRVGCFGRAEGEEVLRVPLERLGLVCEQSAVLRGLRLTGGHPYFLQLLGYRLVEGCLSSGRAAIWVDSVEEAADQVVEQGDIHLRYLWESAGPEGQPVLMALAESEGPLEESELLARLDLNRKQLRLVLERLKAFELIVQNGTAYELRMGLLPRWLKGARPMNEGVSS